MTTPTTAKKTTATKKTAAKRTTATKKTTVVEVPTESEETPVVEVEKTVVAETSVEEGKPVEKETPHGLFIFNCMHEDMLMWVGEGKKRKLVTIPKAPSPELLHYPETPEELTVIVPRKNNKAYPPLKLREYKEEKTIGVLQEPVVLPHTIYLVPPEDVLQFPDRVDFFTPATYEMVVREDVQKPLGKKAKKKNKKSKKSTKKARKDDFMFELNVVAAITRTPYGMRTKDTPLFDDAFFAKEIERSS